MAAPEEDIVARIVALLALLSPSTIVALVETEARRRADAEMLERALMGWIEIAAERTGDGRWRRALKAIHGRRSGRPTIDDYPLLVKMRAFLAEGVAASPRAASRMVAVDELSKSRPWYVEALAKRLHRKYSRSFGTKY